MVIPFKNPFFTMPHIMITLQLCNDILFSRIIIISSKLVRICPSIQIKNILLTFFLQKLFCYLPFSITLDEKWYKNAPAHLKCQGKKHSQLKNNSNKITNKMQKTIE